MCVYRETPRSSWILSLVILASVLILSTPVSVSLPYLPTVDMARVRFNTTVKLKEGNTDIQELRLGIWSACFYNSSGAPTCLKTGLGYTVHMSRIEGNQTLTATIPSRVTTGLVIHPVATAVIFIIFLCSLTTTHRKIMVTLGYLALLLSWTAFSIDINLLVHLGNQLHNSHIGGIVAGGTGLLMTFSTSILFMFSACVARPVNMVPPKTSVANDPPTPGVPAL